MSRSPLKLRSLVLVSAVLLVQARVGIVALDRADHDARHQPFRGAAQDVAAGKLASTPIAPVPPGEAGESGGESDEIQGRADWFYRQRAFPGKSIRPGALAQAEAQAASLDAGSGSRAPVELTWKPIGPHPISQTTDSIYYNGDAPWSGRVTAIDAHPTDVDLAYLGAAAGGVWKTTDGGSNWTPVFDAQPTLAVGAIALAPTSTNTVFVGTGEANGHGGTNEIYFGQGIYRTTNGGSSWAKVGGTLFDNCYISGLQVKPDNANVVIASVSARGANIQGNPNACTNAESGIYRSTNGGTTWVQEIFGAPASDVSISVTSPNTMYAGFYGSGVWKSTDAGANWTQLAGGLPTSSAGGADRTVVEVAPNNANRVYAAIAHTNGDLFGYFTSTNAGASWSRLNADTALCNLGGGGQCWYDLTLAVDPQNSNVSYVGGVYLYRYDLGPANEYHRIGFSNSLNRSTIHVDFHALSFGNSSSRLWVGSDGGAYRTANGGASFTNLNRDLELTQFYPGTSGRANGPYVAGTQDNGTLKYTGQSNTWNEINAGDGGYAAVHPTNPNIIYTSYVNLTLYKSTDGGNNNLTRIDDGMCSNDPCEFIAPFVMDPTDPNRLYAGTDRIWRSTNAGDTWTPISPHFPNTINAIGLAASTSTVIYAGTTGGGVYVTANSGGSWVNTAGNGLPQRIPTDFAVNPANSSEAYVTISGFGTGHVYRTRNRGASWVSVSSNLPDAPTNAIVVNWRDTPDSLYVGSDVGVYRSTDDGASWQSSRSGLPKSPVLDLLFDDMRDTNAGNDKLVAATHGRGAFRAPK